MKSQYRQYDSEKTYYIGNEEVRYAQEVSGVCYFQKVKDGLYRYLVPAEAEVFVTDYPTSSLLSGVDADHDQPTGVTRPFGVVGLVGADTPAPTPSETADETEKRLTDSK